MIDSDKRASLRGMVRAGLGVLAAGVMAREAASQDQKIAQAMVQYQSGPKDGLRCDQCVHWVPPNACKLVVGPIAPAGWCVAFGPKEG